ncbi:tetratricopeptide repeat protein [Aliiruegeria sabulilitoris]|uniref:tetratricopeptide repeat protein n=1 Tax=Aliiruegeria sabulilitoris TaxID=1510458 RepID=UPI0013D4663B|nr:tetratricopeptide repeat protein [Aliiruegeria sabulilitoris]
MTYRVMAVAAVLATLFLSGCDSSEDRAEEHFQAALALLEDGDSTRAVLEMRNALQLVPTHEQARQRLAEIRREQGDLTDAVEQFRALIEDHPENGAGQLALAELAMELGNWEAAEKHSALAAELLGEVPAVRVVLANLSYRAAQAAGDREARDTAIAEAEALVASDPGLTYARRIVIDGLLRQERWRDALEEIDAALVHDPDGYTLYQMRLGVLEQLGRTDEITRQLQDLVERFPEEKSLPLTLVGWYARQGQMDEAEAFLRRRAEAAPDALERQTQLVRFLNEARGAEVAAAELERLSAQGGDNALTYRAMHANLTFEGGDAEAAEAELTALLAELPEDQLRSGIADNVRVDLARMRTLTGDPEGAAALIEDILANDPGHVAALKMLASRQIEEDEVGEAIVNLRAALRESPRDPAILTLMAAAHERAGETDLQREMLSLAVEVSRAAPEESLRYARMLIAQERFRPAEDVLVDALRLHRDDIALYAELGQVYVALEDWMRAEQVLQTLRRLSEESGDRSAMETLNALQVKLLAGQKRDEELFDFLEDLAGQEAGGLAAEVAIIRTYAARGETDKAQDRLEQALARNPDQPSLRFLSATLKASSGEYALAEQELEALLEDFPQAEPVWIALYRTKLTQGEREAASEVLDRALLALPDGANLLFSRAGELQQLGDYDGAIDIYEALYARNSANEIVANNLASLLSMHREDAESMERAYRIGRRLQDSQRPAFRDTYGWIAARMGRLEEAEPHLRFAAEGYPEHPVVQYHYAVALVGLGQEDAALEHFRKAEEFAGDLLPAADLEAARAEIARLEAAQDAR